ncbi:ferredoxin-NADP reductase [Nakamurella sp. UYEF19]|uniref:FAD-dependent oxidoreductase n=1 Tax=Nakamurella sp. UYEF19 TaxID=1756392 RepID=UPI0033931011
MHRPDALVDAPEAAVGTTIVGPTSGAFDLKQRLDDLTGRITMYRLVLLGLGVIGVAAVVISATGDLTYSLGEIIVSAILLVSVTYVSNQIFAGMFAVRPHTESTFITAALLFFLFQPSTDSKALVAMAVAAIVASGSKYLLGVRGRHLFNPAAIGAVWVSLFGIGDAGWWVANPILVWVTLVVAALVLYRTRRLPLGALFVAIALVIIMARTLSDGADPSAAFQAVFTSYPILFFAGFMLSEPLTLPPLKWQQYLVAAVAAVIFSVPITVGSVFLGPEYALVIANLVAFGFGQRRGISLVLQKRTQLTADTFVFSFRPRKPVSFQAGQYLELTLPHKGADARGSRRVFSIASAPGDDESIRLAMKIPTNSSTFKRELARLRNGDALTATTVGGDFLLPKDPAIPLLMIAGGIGITPFLSQLQHRAAGPGNDGVVVVYAVGSPSDLSHVEELERSGATVIVSGPDDSRGLPASWRFAGPGRVDGAKLSRHVPDIAARQVFVSGPPAMVNAVRSGLRAMGVRKVKADYFSGY